MGINEELQAEEREKRNAVHWEVLAQGMQALVRLKALQMELQARALELDLPEHWWEAVDSARSAGLRIQLPLEEIPTEPAFDPHSKWRPEAFMGRR